MIMLSENAEINCGGMCDASALVNTFGGTAPFLYQWNDASQQTGASFPIMNC